MKKAHSTELRLMLAAESLVAEMGFGAVSVRTIIKRAKLKNTSAIYYHFGSVEQMYDELVRFRMLQLDTLRAAELDARGGKANLTLLECARLICDPHEALWTERGFTYAGFLVEYLPARHPGGFPWVMSDIDGHGEVDGDAAPPAMSHILRQLRHNTPPIELGLFRRRIANATLLYLNVLRSLGTSDFGKVEHAILDDALQQFVAVVSAPPSS